MNNTVNTIYQQLRAQGIYSKLTFVAWDENTLKVSRGENGCMITYNHGTDLYDIREYHGLEVSDLAEGVYAESLFAVVMPTFSPRQKGWAA